MAGRQQSGQSLLGASSTGAGTVIALAMPTDRFSIACTLAGSTKCSVRLQGSVDGLNWTNLGAAASTYSSTNDGRIDNTTSARLVSHVRLSVVTLTTGATRKVTGWIAAKGA